MDSNAVIAIISGRGPRVRTNLDAALKQNETIALPAVVMHELWFGIAKSERREANIGLLDVFMDFGIGFLPLDQADAREAGEIRAGLHRAGTPIGPYDLLIGAQARRRGAVLVTANVREFSRIPGLIIQNWAAEPGV